MILLDSIASHLCSIAAQSLSSCKVSWFSWLIHFMIFMIYMTFLKVQETSSWKFVKVRESSWKFMKVHVLMNHSFHCAGYLTGAHGLTLISPPLFFGSCKASCFRDAMNCCHSDSLLRARDPNSFPLPSIVERSSRSYLHEAKHCHLGYSVKRKAPWPNLLLQPGNVETFEISWFY